MSTLRPYEGMKLQYDNPGEFRHGQVVTVHKKVTSDRRATDPNTYHWYITWPDGLSSWGGYFFCGISDNKIDDFWKEVKEE